MIRSQFRLPWKYVSRLVIGILLVAVAFKTTYSRQILASEGLLSSKPLLFSVIGLEAGLIAFLLFSDSAKGRTATLLIFTGYVIASLYAIITSQNCHCFAMVTGPRTSLTVDILVVVLAAAAQRTSERNTNQCMLAGLLSKSAAVGFISAALALGAHQVMLRSSNLDVVLAGQ